MILVNQFYPDFRPLSSPPPRDYQPMHVQPTFVSDGEEEDMWPKTGCHVGGHPRYSSLGGSEYVDRNRALTAAAGGGVGLANFNYLRKNSLGSPTRRGAGLRFQSQDQQAAVSLTQEQMQYLYQKKDPISAASPVDHTVVHGSSDQNRLEISAGGKRSADKTASGGGPKGYNRGKRPSTDYYPIHTEDYDTDFRSLFLLNWFLLFGRGIFRRGSWSNFLPAAGFA